MQSINCLDVQVSEFGFAHGHPKTPLVFNMRASNKQCYGMLTPRFLFQNTSDRIPQKPQQCLMLWSHLPKHIHNATALKHIVLADRLVEAVGNGHRKRKQTLS